MLLGKKMKIQLAQKNINKKNEGTKLDLRKGYDEKFVTTEEGMQKKIGAFTYVECLAKDQINLTNVEGEAVRSIIVSDPLKPKKNYKFAKLRDFI